jgi:hypothetical protein
MTNSLSHKALTTKDVENLAEVARRLRMKKVTLINGSTFSKIILEMQDQEKPLSSPVSEEPTDKVRVPTEDELLYWSTSYEPDIHTSKPE